MYGPIAFYSIINVHNKHTQRLSIPRKGSCFFDSTPHIRQLTSLCNKPPNIAVTIVLFPFGPEKKQHVTSGSQKIHVFPEVLYGAMVQNKQFFNYVTLNFSHKGQSQKFAAGNLFEYR